jgi:CO/xanthine dehydrogenase Mo-binding subunit
MGQGTLTIMPQIAADGLSIGLEHVRCPLADTKYAPDSGPTVASRTAMVVGSTVFGAAVKMRKALEEFASASLLQGRAGDAGGRTYFRGQFSGATRSFRGGRRRLLEAAGTLRVYNQFQLPASIKWDQKTFRGDSYPSYSWGCNVAEVEIDVLTLEIRVTRVTSCWDIGRLINPMLAKGQIEGGLVQALGYAVMEKMAIKDGLYDASRMQTYVVPTRSMCPEMEVQFIEYPYTHAAPGAKGVGEIPMDGLGRRCAMRCLRPPGCASTTCRSRRKNYSPNWASNQGVE